MVVFSNVLHRYVAPFLLGFCMAASTVVSDVPSMVALLFAAAGLAFLMSPAGGRIIARLTSVAA